MAFDKLIVRSLTGAAKSAIKMDLALDSLKERLIDSITTDVEGTNILLPFDTRGTLEGGDLPEDLMSPETVNSVPPIPATQKALINTTLDRIQANLDANIQQKNTLQGALDSILSPLSSLESMSTTLGGIIDGIKIGVTIIKALPAPTSVPPGIGIPLNVINGLSSALDTLGTLISKFEGPLDIIPGSISQIEQLLTPIAAKFATFDPIYEKSVKIIAFMRLLLTLPKDGAVYQWDGNRWNQVTERPDTPPPNSLFGLFGNPNGNVDGDFTNQYYFDGNTSGEGGIQQSDIDNALNSVANSIQKSLEVSSPSSSNSNTNALNNQALLDSLDPNSNNPLFYRGFKLTIEFDPNNTFSFPARRVKGYNSDEGITLYSVPPDQGSGEINTASTYSFSTSVEVLISEVKFNIDNYFISKSRTNEISPIITGLEQTIKSKYNSLQQLLSQQSILLEEQNQESLYFEEDKRLVIQISKEQNEITRLNEELEYWKAQLDLNNSL